MDLDEVQDVLESDQIISGLQNLRINESEMSWNDVLEILPRNEVVNLIFDRLDIEDRLSARSVCKAWNGFVDETVLFRPLLFDQSLEEILKFGATGRDIPTLKVSRFKTEYPKDGLGFSGIGNLVFIPCETKYNCNHKQMEGVSKENLAKILDDYPDIEVLRLHSGALREIETMTVLPTVQLPCLTELVISACNSDDYGMERCAEVLKNTFPKLETVSFVFINSEESPSHLPVYYEDSYRFLAKHSDTLDNVLLSHANCLDERDLELPQLMIDHQIPKKRYLELLQMIDRVNVSKLNLEFTFYEGRSRFQFGIRLLQAQTKLTSITLTNLALPNISIWNAIPEVLRRNSKTLKEVNIQGCFCPVILGAAEPFDCYNVKDCDQLMVLNTDICGIDISNIEDLPRQIETLNLGQMLTLDQINFIVKNMANLNSFKLPQGMSKTEAGIPKVTATIVKEVLKLPNLVSLTLRKPSSAYRKIRKMVSKAPWIKVVPVNLLIPEEFADESNEEGEVPQGCGDYFKLKIDLSQKPKPSTK